MNEFIGRLIWLAERLTPPPDEVDVVAVVEVEVDELGDMDDEEMRDEAVEVAEEAFVSHECCCCC